ncbi:MAG TPA: 6-phosphogluconolactonase [Capsulimonadaceae bacterium]|nr:6-phosphogluconolactonase [Capsulimonadaceae bacterium]
MAQEVTKPEVIRISTADDLAREAVDRIVADAQRAIAERSRFLIVLAGGSTPKRTYELLSSPQWADKIDWSKVYAFFGDERFVPPDDDRSNFGMARETLLSRVPIPESHVFPVPTDKATADDAALAYGATLREFFEEDSYPPRFDLVLLGMGDDGHTASLFPGAGTLGIQDFWVVWSPPGTLPPPVDRITFTFSTLNAARHVLFLVSGEKKATALADILQGDASSIKRPAAGVQPTDGTLTWLIDDAAAKELND